MADELPVQETKRALRQSMRQTLARLDPAKRAADSECLRRRLAEAPEFRAASHLLGFVPLPSEPDLLPLLVAEAARGRAIYLPRWDASSQTYVPARMIPGRPLQAGPFSVLEPPADAAVLPHQRLDLILVPGLAFDDVGRRLGRGRGFYDRLLAQADRARRWGVAFDLQVVDAVPHEIHDVKLDRIATPSFWLSDGRRQTT